MERKIEIEKLIRGAKPKAKFMYANKFGLYYKATLGDVPVFFKVPLAEVSESVTKFEDYMPSQLLIRYLID